MGMEDVRWRMVVIVRLLYCWIVVFDCFIVELLWLMVGWIMVDGRWINGQLTNNLIYSWQFSINNLAIEQ
jgi:hypothetical protein